MSETHNGPDIVLGFSVSAKGDDVSPDGQALGSVPLSSLGMETAMPDTSKEEQHEQQKARAQPLPAAASPYPKNMITLFSLLPLSAMTRNGHNVEEEMDEEEYHDSEPLAVFPQHAKSSSRLTTSGNSNMTRHYSYYQNQDETRKARAETSTTTTSTTPATQSRATQGRIDGDPGKEIDDFVLLGNSAAAAAAAGHADMEETLDSSAGDGFVMV